MIVQNFAEQNTVGLVIEEPKRNTRRDKAMVETVLAWIGVGLIGTVALGLTTLIVIAIIMLIKIIIDM